MRNYSILIVAVMALWAGAAAEARYSGGTGTAGNPYRIATPQDLNDIGNYEDDWNKNFILINDVSLAQYTGTKFKSIGKWVDYDDPNNKSFTGIFDGKNHKIWNFTWFSQGIDDIGLFGYVGLGGQIRNLSLENVDVNAVNGNYIGGLVGFNEGMITNCYVTGTVSGDLCGGLVGENDDGNITNCYSSGSVSGDWGVGGLVGASTGTISNCHSTGSVSGTALWVGGLVGYVARCTIFNCYSTGSVSGDWNVGGLVGVVARPMGVSSSTISDCHSTGSVTGEGGVGGLVGYNEDTITNCHSTGPVTGTGDYVGGLVGKNSEGTINICYSTGSVSGTGSVSATDYVGGLVGENEENGTISNCHSVGSVSGTGYYVGGLVGYAEGTITDCYSTGGVDGNNTVGGLVGFNDGFNHIGAISGCYSSGPVSGTGDCVGGLVGYSDFGSITNCHSTSAVNGDGDVGGLVGGNWCCTISNCYSSGSVCGTEYNVGGLVGFNNWTITNCYSTGSVSGTDNVGGLVGGTELGMGDIFNCYSSGPVNGTGSSVGGLLGYNYDGLITNCYSTGSVAGTDRVGGLVGSNDMGAISNSFWDINTSGRTTSAGGEGKTTAKMKTKSTFTNAGWDFVNIWDICERTNYPRFIWQIPIGDFICPDGVDFTDFAILSSAWQSGPNEPNWRPACDISEPKDNLIDELDLAVFCENWLKGH